MSSYFYVARAGLVLCALSFASPATADPATATIRGDLQRVSLGNVGTYIYGIDGRMIHPSPPTYKDPITLAPGPHSLLIGFNASKYVALPVRLEAKAGAAYVARFEQTGQSRDEMVSFIWIEDETSHEIIVPKRQVIPEVKAAATYVPPASGATATIQGTATSDATGATFTRAVDGVETATPDAARTQPLALATGPRALLISFISDRFIANLPVLIDMKAGERYIIGYEMNDQRFSSQAAPVFKLWVENETTHERVVPATRAPVRVLKYTMDVKPAHGGRK
ncbi:MAG: hypothetical protein ACOH12_05610 [Parvibaculaceae bacterium]